MWLHPAPPTKFFTLSDRITIPFSSHQASGPTILFDMATQGFEGIQKRTAASMDQAVDTSTAEQPPLFSKDTLYHASLGCYIVNICNDMNYEIGGLNIPGHRFVEATMSIRGYGQQKPYVDRYMIAKHADDTYFVAFQGDRGWRSKYASFTDS